jgi:CRISPR-associated protein Cas1
VKKLLNTLYVMSPQYYLSLDGENIVISEDKAEVARMPLHNLGDIVVFTYKGASPMLMGKCMEYNISITFLTPYGKFLGRVSGKTRGNVALRRNQFHIADDEEKSLEIARNTIIGKIYNCRWVLERIKRDHELQVNADALKDASQKLKEALENVQKCCSESELRGIEGSAAAIYFSVFREMILQQKDDFQFSGRNRRPPLDRVNALLSFVYTLLTSMMTGALETVGLDPAVGFMHGDRPGRNSLALDMVEELRPALADRFVLMLINKKIVTAKDFDSREDGAVLLSENGRKTVLKEWQKRKQMQIVHPYLDEKVQWGMVPYAQAMLLARTIRGDLEAYPPFMWK